jgi:hypothetical protein
MHQSYGQEDIRPPTERDPAPRPKKQPKYFGHKEMPTKMPTHKKPPPARRIIALLPILILVILWKTYGTRRNLDKLLRWLNDPYFD